MPTSALSGNLRTLYRGDVGIAPYAMILRRNQL